MVTFPGKTSGGVAYAGRGHAEWVLGRVLAVPGGTASLEAEPPGRLRGEPGVFGGSTGAKVFVEVLRRIVSPTEAVERLGGGARANRRGAETLPSPEASAR